MERMDRRVGEVPDKGVGEARVEDRENVRPRARPILGVEGDIGVGGQAILRIRRPSWTVWPLHSPIRDDRRQGNSRRILLRGRRRRGHGCRSETCRETSRQEMIPPGSNVGIASGLNTRCYREGVAALVSHRAPPPPNATNTLIARQTRDGGRHIRSFLFLIASVKGACMRLGSEIAVVESLAPTWGLNLPTHYPENPLRGIATQYW